MASVRALSGQHASTTQRTGGPPGEQRLMAQQPPACRVQHFRQGVPPAAPPLAPRVGGSHGARRAPGPCRLTNTQDELDPYRKPDDEFIEVSQIQVPNPELGPLERRITTTYLEALEHELEGTEDMEYWFNPPEGGWNQVPLRLKKLKELPVEVATGRNFGGGRAPIGNFAEGCEVEGEVTRQMLTVGAQVDFGADYDGLIPVNQEQWLEGVRDVLDVGTKVRCRIHRVRDLDWFRFPVQLELLSPALEGRLSPPDEHEAPVDFRGKPSDMATYQAKTGRTYRQYRYWAPTPAGEFDDDDPDDGGDKRTAIDVSDDIQLRIQRLAAGIR